MIFLNVSLWVVLISAAINLAGSALWYGPLFGTRWAIGMGLAPPFSALGYTIILYLGASLGNTIKGLL